MTEQALQQQLKQTSGFAKRQRLLKQLWKLRRARERMQAETAQTPPPAAADRSTGSASERPKTSLARC